MTPAASGATALGLDEDLLRRLERLSLPSRRPVAGPAAGLRRSRRPGSSAELLDFRSYAPGDDFRRIDWNVWARLDRLLLRLYAGEEDLCVTLWLDVSASMDWGDPPKLAAARGLAGGLLYAALSGSDRAALVAFASSVVARSTPLRGRRSCPRLWRLLESAAGGGGTDFAVVAAAARSVPRGLAVVISDFLTESDPARALAALRSAGHEVVLLQLLSPQELEPELRGELRLVDAETGAAVEISATAGALAAYRRELRAHTERLTAMARAHGAALLQLSSGTPLSRLLLVELPSRGLLR